MPPEQVGADQVKARLTRYSPTLGLLGAPQQVDEYRPLSGPLATRIVSALSSLSEYVILDLPPEPTDAVREALRLSSYVGVVVDREMACVEAARACARFLRKWGPDVSAGLVVVHRSPLVCPLGIETLTEATGLVVSELIPPAADACVAASREGLPVVQAYDDALIGTSLKALAANLAADPIITKKPA
jgi:Flp pilus assembly CpaE family ATPase